MASKKTVFYHHRKFTFLVFFSEFFLCLKCSSFSKINSHSCSLTETLVLHYFFSSSCCPHIFIFYFFLTRKFHRSPFAGRCFFWILTFLAFSKVSPVRLVEFYSKRVFLFLFFLSEKSFFLFTSWLCRSMPKIFYPNENFSCIHCVDFKKDVALKEVVGSLKSRKLRFFYLCFWCRKFYALFFKGHFDVESKVA